MSKSFKVTLPKSFNYELSRNSSDLEVGQILSGSSFYKALRFSNEILAIKVSPVEGHLKVRLLNVGLTKSRKVFLENHISESFDLGTDLAKFYRLGKKDEILKPLVKKYKGLHLQRVPELFETLCWAIIGQQINLSFAHAVKTDFVKKYGDSVEVEGKKLYVFPTWEKVLRIKETSLQKLRFSRQKATYVKEVAKAMKAGLNKTELAAMNYEEAIAELVKIKGVGTWTANYTLLRCLGLGDAFPVKDVALQKAFQRQLGLDKKPKADELLIFQDRWKPFCHYATLYLWRSLSD